MAPALPARRLQDRCLVQLVRAWSCYSSPSWPKAIKFASGCGRCHLLVAVGVGLDAAVEVPLHPWSRRLESLGVVQVGEQVDSRESIPVTGDAGAGVEDGRRPVGMDALTVASGSSHRGLDVVELLDHIHAVVSLLLSSAAGDDSVHD